MYFTFEHECDNLPMTLTIYVEYSIWTWPGTYDQPAELDIHTKNIIIECGKLDVTSLLKSTIDEKLNDEIETAINDAIWKDYHNK